MMMKESLAHYFDYFFASKSLHLVDKCTQNWLHRRYHHVRAHEPQELVFLVFCILKGLCHFHPFSIKEPPFRNCIVLAKECRITHVERHLAVLSKALPKKLWKRRGARANTSWIEVNPIWWSWANAENCMVFFSGGASVKRTLMDLYYCLRKKGTHCDPGHHFSPSLVRKGTNLMTWVETWCPVYTRRWIVFRV